MRATHALRRQRRAVALTGAAWLLAASASAVPPGGPTPGGTATRAVAEYSLLEARLADLVARGDRTGLEALVADDFAALGPASRDPGDRAAFLDAALAHPRGATIYSLAVLERGELDLVSFLMRRAPRSPARQAGPAAYVVDVWRRADHRLVARYTSEARRAPPPPDAPTGRD